MHRVTRPARHIDFQRSRETGRYSDTTFMVDIADRMRVMTLALSSYSLSSQGESLKYIFESDIEAKRASLYI